MVKETKYYGELLYDRAVDVERIMAARRTAKKPSAHVRTLLPEIVLEPA